MNEREAFIAAIAANPGEDTPRLAFADWLQENGEEYRAQFIRLACELGHRKYKWDDDHKRADDLVLRNWPVWFAPLFRALRMPEPEAPVPPREPWHEWICGPYRVSGSVMMFNLFRVRFVGEEEPDENYTPPPANRFLNYLGFAGGLVTHLHAALGFRLPGCSLAEAFRLEPVHTLTLELDPDPGHWHAIADPCLRRVRDLTLSLPTYGAWGTDYADTAGAILDDESFSGVQKLEFLGVDQTNYGASCPTIDYFARPSVVERVMETVVANAVSHLRVCVGRDAALAVAEAPALANLRSLDLGWNRIQLPKALALRQYRGQLEELDLLENAVSAEALASGRPWARLTTLRLTGDFFQDGQFGAFARADAFPALTHLSLGTDEMTQLMAPRSSMGLPPLRYEGLPEQLRRVQFPCLTHLNLSGYELPDDSAVALAEMAKRTGIRELDLRANVISNEAKARACELLGDRVLLEPPRDSSKAAEDDAIPF